jgi:hypothetical protein
MRRIAWWFDCDPGKIEPGRQYALGGQPVERGHNETPEIAENVAGLCHTEL